MDAIISILKSFGYAWRGLLSVLESERNARIHLSLAAVAVALGLYLGVPVSELAAIYFAIIIVFIAEIFNTAVEKTLDLVQPHSSEKVRLIKDTAAAAVLVASIGALVIGVVVFYPYILERLWQGR